MQTAFTADQLREPDIAEAAGILKDCVHYGFCTAVCPTWVLLRDENDGPRGRIDLIKAMMEAAGPPPAKTVRHIDRCLSCNACMSTCAAKVDYMHLVDRARVRIERHFRRPPGDRLLRALIATVLPNPTHFRAALRPAVLIRPVARHLSGRVGNLARLAPDTMPARHAAHGKFPAQGKRRLRVALLAGCVGQVLAPHVNAATVRLLTRHGCEVVLAPGAVCCGALTLHMGKEALAKRAAGAAIAAWSTELETGGLDAVVVNASGCGTTVKDYGHLFRHDAALRPAAERIAALALDVTELMARLGLNAPTTPRRLAVAYHDACSLQHAQRVTVPPRDLLRAAGFVVRDVPEGHFCCGSAGTYNLLQPKLAARLGARKAAHIEGTGAAIVAAGNFGCLTQIALHSDVPAVHTAELLDWATSGPMPPALAGRTLAEEASEPKQAPSAAIGIW